MGAPHFLWQLLKRRRPDSVNRKARRWQQEIKQSEADSVSDERAEWLVEHFEKLGDPASDYRQPERCHKCQSLVRFPLKKGSNYFCSDCVPD